MARKSIPKGYTSIDTITPSWPTDDTNPGDAIMGEVTGYKSVSFTRGGKSQESSIIQIDTADGLVEVWESTVLRPLFADDYTGYEVYIEYCGRGKKSRGKNPAKLFKIAYKS